MANSFIVEKLNSCFNFFQNRFAYFVENSLILQNIDNFIFVLILGTVFLTTFASSSLIGMAASCVIVLTFLKLLILKGEKLELQSFDFALIIYLLFLHNKHNKLHTFSSKFVRLEQNAYIYRILLFNISIPKNQ